jgi:hypothetical protein
MEVQAKSELDCEKKEPRKLHKLRIFEGTSASRNLRPISTVSASDTIEKKDYYVASVNIARAVDTSFLRRGQVLQ